LKRIGLYTDFKFIWMHSYSLKYNTPHIFKTVKLYYNHWIYLTYEILLYIGFVVSAIWATFDTQVSASGYIEQFLFSMMGLVSKKM
jgi:hypothetical protein